MKREIEIAPAFTKTGDTAWPIIIRNDEHGVVTITFGDGEWYLINRGEKVTLNPEGLT